MRSQRFGGALVLAHFQAVELQPQLVQQALVESDLGPHTGNDQHAAGRHDDLVAGGGQQIGTVAGGGQLGVDRLACLPQPGHCAAELVKLAVAEPHVFDLQPDSQDVFVGGGVIEASDQRRQRGLQLGKSPRCARPFGIFAGERQTNDDRLCGRRLSRLGRRFLCLGSREWEAQQRNHAAKQ